MLEYKHLETIKYYFHEHLKGSRNRAKMKPMIKPHDTLPIICAKVSRASYQKFYTTLFILHINSSVVILLGIAKKMTATEQKAIYVQYLLLLVVLLFS